MPRFAPSWLRVRYAIIHYKEWTLQWFFKAPFSRKLLLHVLCTKTYALRSYALSSWKAWLSLRWRRFRGCGSCGLAFLSSLPFGTVVTVIADFRGEEVLERYHVSIIGSTSTICLLSELLRKVSFTSAPWSRSSICHCLIHLINMALPTWNWIISDGKFLGDRTGLIRSGAIKSFSFSAEVLK